MEPTGSKPSGKPSRFWPIILAVLGVAGVGTIGVTAVSTSHTPPAVTQTTPTATDPATPTAPAVPTMQAAALTSTSTPTATASPSWNGIAVTVVCPTSTTGSLQAVCPDYFTTNWLSAAQRDGYSQGSQKLAKVDCGMHRLDQLDAVTRDSLTCRDGLNTAVYGVNGSGGLCVSEVGKYCKGIHPTPGSNPTDVCLQGVITDGDPSTSLSDACTTAVANHAYAEAAQTGK